MGAIACFGFLLPAHLCLWNLCALPLSVSLWGRGSGKHAMVVGIVACVTGYPSVSGSPESPSTVVGGGDSWEGSQFPSPACCSLAPCGCYGLTLGGGWRRISAAAARLSYGVSPAIIEGESPSFGCGGCCCPSYPLLAGLWCRGTPESSATTVCWGWGFSQGAWGVGLVVYVPLTFCLP